MSPGGAGAGPVLVLGATGLIGGYCAERLESSDRPVVRASRNGRDADLACELTDPGSVAAALESVSPEAVVMAAGISSTRSAWDDPVAAFEINTRGVFNLLEAIRNSVPESHLVIASSGAVYGAGRTGTAEETGGGSTKSEESLPVNESRVTRFTEDDPARPASPYAASKSAAELFCGQYAREHGLSVSVARIFNQIGPRQPADQAPAEFAGEIARAEAAGAGEVRLEVGNPGAERDYTDVRDTARALVGLCDGRAAGTFNVCSGIATDLASIVAGLDALTPIAVRVEVRPDRAHPVDPPSLSGSNRRVAEATGWRPEIPLSTSLADLLEDRRQVEDGGGPARR